jgi:hypothetical protein
MGRPKGRGARELPARQCWGLLKCLGASGLVRYNVRDEVFPYNTMLGRRCLVHYDMPSTLMGIASS